MVIGIDASRAQLAHKTGTEWYSFYIIQELKKIIPSSYTVRLYSKEPLSGELAKLPAHWESRVLSWKGMLWTQLRLSLEMLIHPVDVLYVSAHTLPLIGGKKNVSVIHDVGFLRNIKLYDTKDVARGGSSLIKKVIHVCVRIVTMGRFGASERDYHRFAFDIAVKKSDAIITISQFSFDEICAVSKDQSVRNRLHIVYNGFVRRVIPHDAIDRIKELGVDMPYILTLGRIEEKKNMLRCIESFALAIQRTDWKGDLVCVGTFSFGAERIVARVKELGIEKRVHFLGWQDEAQVASLLAHADVFYFPTLYEGFGMPVVEALDMNIPVVCSDIPVLREIAGDSVLYCNPLHVEDMADVLVRAIGEPRHAKDHYMAQRIAETFQWSQAARKTFSIIEFVL